MAASYDCMQRLAAPSEHGVSGKGHIQATDDQPASVELYVMLPVPIDK